MKISINQILRYLIVVTAVMTPVGLIIMLSPELKREYIWTTSIFLSIQFSALMIYTYLFFRNRKLLFVVPLLLVSGYFIELLGVRTGFPFGDYEYTQTLQPQIAGVPLAISLSWVLVVMTSYFIISKSVGNKIAVSMLTGAMVLAFDVLLEPFAAFINSYWVWYSSSVPLINYVSWFLISVLFALLLSSVLKPVNNAFEPKFLTAAVPEILFGINILQFTLINIYNGYILQTVFGLIIISGILLIRFGMSNKLNLRNFEV